MKKAEDMSWSEIRREGTKLLKKTREYQKGVSLDIENYCTLRLIFNRKS